MVILRINVNEILIPKEEVYSKKRTIQLTNGRTITDYNINDLFVHVHWSLKIIAHKLRFLDSFQFTIKKVCIKIKMRLIGEHRLSCLLVVSDLQQRHADNQAYCREHQQGLQVTHP